MKRTVGLRCTICNHPARPQIDLAIATGLSKRAVAERFGVSRDAVWRHAQTHLTAEMRAALATKLLQREGDTRRILLEEGAGVSEALTGKAGRQPCRSRRRARAPDASSLTARTQAGPRLMARASRWLGGGARHPARAVPLEPPRKLRRAVAPA